MTDFSQMHVFFTVTTAAVILITALLCAMIVALTRLFATLNRIASNVQEGAQELKENLDELREDIKQGFRLVPFMNFFGKSASRIAATKKPRTRAPARKAKGE